jgi:ribosomal protein S25
MNVKTTNNRQIPKIVVMFNSKTFINEGKSKNFINMFYTESEQMDETMSSIKLMVKSFLKEILEEIMGESLSESVCKTKTISSDDLCDHWGISKNTLRNREKEGIISPIAIHGRKKMYSMRDVMEIDAAC